MSHIPNSAMPHAAPQDGGQTGQSTGRSGGRFDQLTSKVREHPKTAAAAGAALTAGIAAAAAIPVLRARGRKGSGGSSSKG